VHELIARVMYHFGVHLLYASMVGAAAWGLTSLRSSSATTKYWIWVAATFNFIVPTAAVVDKLWAPHLGWATPLGAIGDPVWNLTQGWTAVALAALWIAGSFAMFLRLIARIRRERQSQASVRLSNQPVVSGFLAAGIPVNFDTKHRSPAVCGIFKSCIVLPMGIDRLLNQREFDAVLLHELAHARRHDNLIRLLYELSLCALWFHPLIWLAGSRMALYRELSCDESVIQRAHGTELVSALAKLALPEQGWPLQAAASSHLSYRLARLAGPTPTTSPAANLLLTSLFAAVIAAGVFQTVAHTACCFVLKR
jgi:beta-lactamase regulating signal transducer with metallopeptidase domain